MKPLALIWGESLVGSGHARIQSALARALQGDGWRVGVVTSSRERIQGFDFGEAEIFWQPSLKLCSPSADPYKMSNLVTPHGLSLVDDLDYQAERREYLLNLYDRLKPRAVITEMWPFARANFDFELIPLADHIEAQGEKGAALFSIARDIMFPPSLSSPDSVHVEENRHRIARKYFKSGHILVRGDDAVLPLETSVGVLSEDLKDRLCYVGYFGLTGPYDTSEEHRIGDVLVTSGGGVTQESLEMFKACIAVKDRTSLSDRIWRILIPNTCPLESRREIERCAEGVPGIIVEDNRPDFVELLSTAPLIICHGGNTIIEALSLRTRVLVIPREYAKNNREQQIRARAFETEGLITTAMIGETQDPLLFASRISEALHSEPKQCEIRARGAETASAIISETIYHQDPETEPGSLMDYLMPQPRLIDPVPQFS
jgi:predicted glycosyltransferase